MAAQPQVAESVVDVDDEKNAKVFRKEVGGRRASETENTTVLSTFDRADPLESLMKFQRAPTKAWQK